MCVRGRTLIRCMQSARIYIIFTFRACFARGCEIALEDARSRSPFTNARNSREVSMPRHYGRCTAALAVLVHRFLTSIGEEDRVSDPSSERFE